MPSSLLREAGVTLLVVVLVSCGQEGLWLRLPSSPGAAELPLVLATDECFRPEKSGMISALRGQDYG